MIGENINRSISDAVRNILKSRRRPRVTEGLIETDNFGEVLEKLIILHIRTWMLEDAIGVSRDNHEIASLKKKIDICFKDKRPKYIEAINSMMDNAIINEKKLSEESVKLYKVGIND